MESMKSHVFQPNEHGVCMFREYGFVCCGMADHEFHTPEAPKPLAAPLPESTMTGQFDTNCPNCNGDPCLPSCKHYVSPLPEIASEANEEDRREAVRLCNSSGILVAGVVAEARVAQLIAFERNHKPSPVPLGEGASEATEVWLVEFRSDVYPEWTSWHFEFYQSKEDADSEVQELRQGKAGLAHSRSEFRATRYAALASKAVPVGGGQ